MSNHTSGPRMVPVSLGDGKQCEVHFGSTGTVSFVRIVLRTKGDSNATRRTLRLDGPTARAAIAKAEGEV